MEEEVPEPRLLKILLVIKSMMGVERPSPMAPRKPKAISHISTVSACIKIVLKEEREEELPLFLLPLPPPSPCAIFPSTGHFSQRDARYTKSTVATLDTLIPLKKLQWNHLPYIKHAHVKGEILVRDPYVCYWFVNDSMTMRVGRFVIYYKAYKRRLAH